MVQPAMYSGTPFSARTSARLTPSRAEIVSSVSPGRARDESCAQSRATSGRPATTGVRPRKAGPYKRGGGRGWRNAGSLIDSVPTTNALPFNYRRCGVLGALCAALSANAPLAARATCELGPRSAIAGRRLVVAS